MTQGRAPRALVYLALITQTLISSLTFIAAKRALGELPPLVVVLLRNVGATVCFLMIAAVFVRPLFPPRHRWGRILLLGLLGVPLNQALLLVGLRSSTPAHAALLYTLTPLFVLLIAMATRAERASTPKLVGLMVALSGAAIVVFERTGDLSGGSLFGDLLILGAVLAWGAYTVLGKPLVAAHGPIAATVWALTAGTVLLLPFGVPAAAAAPLAKLSTVAWGSIAFLALFTSVVSYLCWSYALRELEPSRVAVFSNLQPVGTSFASWLIFGEQITQRLVFGGGLVILGVLVTTQAANWRWGRASATAAVE